MSMLELVMHASAHGPRVSRKSYHGLSQQYQRPQHWRNTLLNEWNALSATIIHAEQPVIPDLPKKNYAATPTCIDCDRCLCGPRGDEIWRMKKWICAWMTDQLRTPDRRAALQSGRVVLHIVGWAHTDDPLADDDLISRGEGTVRVERLLHVSDMSFSPYMPHFRKLHVPPVWEFDADGYVDLHAVAPAQYCGLLDTCDELWIDGGGTTYEMKAFRFNSADIPLPIIRGRVVTVERLPHCDEVSLWEHCGQFMRRFSHQSSKST